MISSNNLYEGESRHKSNDCYVAAKRDHLIYANVCE